MSTDSIFLTMEDIVRAFKKRYNEKRHTQEKEKKR